MLVDKVCILCGSSVSQASLEKLLPELDEVLSADYQSYAKYMMVD
jgi:hypothetical protein